MYGVLYSDIFMVCHRLCYIYTYIVMIHSVVYGMVCVRISVMIYVVIDGMDYVNNYDSAWHTYKQHGIRCAIYSMTCNLRYANMCNTLFCTLYDVICILCCRLCHLFWPVSYTSTVTYVVDTLITYIMLYVLI